MSSVRARPLAVPPPPEIFLQLAQWQAVTRSNGTCDREPDASAEAACPSARTWH